MIVRAIIAGMIIVWCLGVLWVAAPDHAVARALGTESFAAWLQAIFSVVAIIAVFAAQREDHRHDRQLREDEQRDREAAECEALNLVIAQSRVTLDHCADRSERQGWNRATALFSLAQVETDLELLKQIDFKTLPNRKVVSVYFRAGRALLSARRQLEMVLDFLPEQYREDFFDAPAETMRSLTGVLAPYVPKQA